MQGEVAQLVEHTTENRGVAGSCPALATKFRRTRPRHTWGGFLFGLRGVTSTFFSSGRVLSKVSKMGALLVVSVVRTSVRKTTAMTVLQLWQQYEYHLRIRRRSVNTLNFYRVGAQGFTAFFVAEGVIDDVATLTVTHLRRHMTWLEERGLGFTPEGGRSKPCSTSPCARS